MLLFCVNTHTKQPFLFHLSWLDLGCARSFFCLLTLCITSSFVEQSIKGTSWLGEVEKKVIFSFHCMVVTVCKAEHSQPGVTQQFFSEYAASHEL